MKFIAVFVGYRLIRECCCCVGCFVAVARDFEFVRDTGGILPQLVLPQLAPVLPRSAVLVRRFTY